MTEPSAGPQPGDPTVASAGAPAAVDSPPSTHLPSSTSRARLGGLGLPLLFLLPAIAFLGALVVYPTISTFLRSLYSDSGSSFVGLDNYRRMFTLGDTLTAIKNNAIWVVAAPSIVTALGLMFAVLAERISWSSALKFVVFMPMAIGFLASGVIFRLVYQADPNQGLANAVVVSVHDLVLPASHYPKAVPRDGGPLVEQGGTMVLRQQVAAGSAVLLPLVGLQVGDLPRAAVNAAPPPVAPAGAVTGTVWVDFQRGGGGRAGVIDPGEKGMPDVRVEIVRGTDVVSTVRTRDNGTFIASGLTNGVPYTVRLAASNFAPPFKGVSWLGPSLATPAIIGAYVWMWAGFAMVLIGAGLAAIPRDALEAARVDGASEWQVFRRVTVPLLAPVLLVVLVTLVINVLKIFDLVLILATGQAESSANVLALEMWRVSFGGQPQQGLGSAIAIFLFLLVVPAMLFNIRRFRQEQR